MWLAMGTQGDDLQDSAGTIGESLADTNISRGRSVRATQRLSALGEMTGGIAHDFRNVLAVIATGLRIAEENAGNPAKAAQAVAAAHEGVERGLKMIARLLAFAAQQELDAPDADVNALIEKLKSFLKYSAGSGIRVVFEPAHDLPKCLVDPPQFNAAILNLVVNARDSMPEGGTIRISTAAVRRMNAGELRNYVRVRVRDHGVGMPPEVIGRIFDPYFTTKGEHGTGLGIPQVHSLARQLGGFIRVNSVVGEGTSFDLFFPTHEEKP